MLCSQQAEGRANTSQEILTDLWASLLPPRLTRQFPSKGRAQISKQVHCLCHTEIDPSSETTLQATQTSQKSRKRILLSPKSKE